MNNNTEPDALRTGRTIGDEEARAARWAQGRTGRTGLQVGCFEPQPENERGEHYRLCGKPAAHSGDHVYLRPFVMEHLEIHMGVPTPLCLVRDDVLKRACMAPFGHGGNHWMLFPSDLEGMWGPRPAKSEDPERAQSEGDGE